LISILASNFGSVKPREIIDGVLDRLERLEMTKPISPEVASSLDDGVDRVEFRSAIPALLRIHVYRGAELVRNASPQDLPVNLAAFLSGIKKIIAALDLLLGPDEEDREETEG
jgi:hypothetical protein